VAGIHFQYVSSEDATRGAPLTDGQRGGRYIVRGAEMGANSPSLSTELFQLTFGQKAD
jgi:hypothetical protein